MVLAIQTQAKRELGGFLTSKWVNPYLAFFLKPSNQASFSSLFLKNFEQMENNHQQWLFSRTHNPRSLPFPKHENTHSKTNFWSYPLIHYILRPCLAISFWLSFLIFVLNLFILFHLHHNLSHFYFGIYSSSFMTFGSSF